MKWDKTDFVYTSTGIIDGFHGAAVPQAIHWKDSICRIFYSARNENNQSHIFRLDIDMESLKITDICHEPVLYPGRLGCFDDSGALMSWIGRIDNEYRLYYCGWNLGKTVPFRNSIGLAVSSDGEHFTRKYEGPVVDRTYREPHFCTNPWIIKEDIYRMWYLSCVEWRIENGELQHRYHLKYAESSDGIEWKRDGKVAIDFADDSEYAISRPTVIKGKNGYHMWFSHRGDKYRIGYARSEDGITWKRMDEEAGITVSPDGFDSEMICYPAVFRYGDDCYMLFNGNEYGMTGFGIAKLAEGDI
ncbi:MAG: hypothetical protein K6F73_07005 [Lachnospiraceae bacterium]|nr:hypothetical protein [Lachnospiraceae bacterium]